MGNKSYRRIKAGELGLADLLSGDSLQIIGLEEYYSDIKTGTDSYGRPFEKGKTLRAPAVGAIVEHFDLAPGRAQAVIFKSAIKGKTPDALFTELMTLEGIGQETAVLACIAFLDKLPDLKYIYATSIHRALFVAYGNETGITDMKRVLKKRKSKVDTILTEETARETARAMAESMLATSKLKAKPDIDEVVELALSTGVDRSGKFLIDSAIRAAECETRELVKANMPVPAYGSVDGYAEAGMYPDQFEAFKGILECDRGIMLLQGGPGSGKSHIITAIVRQYQSVGAIPLVTSYMNKACLNLFERMRDGYCFSDLYNSPGVPTIHSVYGKLVSAKEWKMYRWPLIIVDESSVLSSDLLRMLMYIHSHSPDTRILLVGDRYQLPPVCAYGTPFHKLMGNNNVAKFELTGFHRSNGQGIYELLTKLSSAESGSRITIDRNDDVSLYKARDMEQSLSLAGMLVAENRGDMRRLVVVTETNVVKDEFNTAMACKHLGVARSELTFRKSNNRDTVRPTLPGMRIVATDNLKHNTHVSCDVAKNEFGTLLEFDGHKALVRLDIMDRTVEIDDPKLYMSSFDVGYASTVYKYQGSEADVVVYCIENYRNMNGNEYYRQKELKYVGMSRAKKKLHIVAIDEGAVSKGCQQVERLCMSPSNVDKAFMCF